MKLQDGSTSGNYVSSESNLYLPCHTLGDAKDAFRFEQINPTPTWAQAARGKLHKTSTKRRRPSHSSSASEPEDDVEELLHSTGDIISRPEKSTALPSTKIDILNLRDANQAARSEREISSVKFHPSPTVPVLLTAGSDRRLRLFNVSRRAFSH